MRFRLKEDQCEHTASCGSPVSLSRFDPRDVPPNETNSTLFSNFPNFKHV